MRFRSLPAQGAQWLTGHGLRPPDLRTRQALMIALAAPLAPVPMAVGAAALLPGGIAERLDLLGICILTGLTAALCAALGVFYVLTLPQAHRPRSEVGRMRTALRDEPSGRAEGHVEPSFLFEQEPLRRAG